MSPVEQELVPDLAFDYQLIATYVSTWLGKLKKPRPNVAHLTSAITNVTLEDTIEGASNLTVTFVDPRRDLIEFFDVEKNGRISPIELNYPNNSQYWWRLTQMDVNQNAMGPLEVTLTFMERVAVLMMHKHGPKKTKRGKMTRAEFLKSLTQDVKAERIKFQSAELHETQTPIGRDPVNPSRDSTKKKGLHTGMGLKMKNVTANGTQLKLCEAALDVAYYDRGSDELAVRAMVCAGIGESVFKEVTNSYGYGGVFQGQVAKPGGTNWFAAYSPGVERTKEEAKSFLAGGRGYQQGGAEHLASTNKDLDPGEIATMVEASGKPGEFYGKYSGEADDIITAYGGGFTGGTISYRKAFFFRIGDEEHPHIDYWTGSQELAEEVNWRYFCNGRTIYFDHDMTLIQQKPIAVINRSDPALVGYRATWDSRRIATTCELELICSPFEFAAGEVLLLQDFGPLSTGSMARPKPLPGRWLIVNTTRSSGDIVTTLELAQPERPKREPANEIGERSVDDEMMPGSVVTQITPDMTPKDIVDQMVLPLALKHDMTYPKTAAELYRNNQNHDKLTDSGNLSDHWVYDGNEQGTKSYAADMGNGRLAPDPHMADLADELAAKFGFPNGNGRYDFANHSEGLHRYQLIHGVGVEGHANHVHFGVKQLYGPSLPGH